MTDQSNPFGKIYADANAALHDLFDGARIMSGGFGLCGNAENCIQAIAASNKKDFTVISNNIGNQGQGLAVLLQKNRIKEAYCSFVGGNPDLAEKMSTGEVKVHLTPRVLWQRKSVRVVPGWAAFTRQPGWALLLLKGKMRKYFKASG